MVCISITNERINLTLGKFIYQIMNIRLFCIEMIEKNVIPIEYDFKMPYLLEYWLDRSEIWNTYWIWSLDHV